MKINYNGQELETITEGYWPEGVTLLHSDSGTEWEAGAVKAICLHNGRALYADGRTGVSWEHWAVLPSKPAPRRLTNREVYSLSKKGWDVLNNGDAVFLPSYCIEDEDKICNWVKKLRAPGSDEWVEPTTDLLEVAK